MTASPAFRPLQPALEATPGPWRATRESGGRLRIDPAEGHLAIADVFVPAEERAAAVGRANAALVAAAPRLYAALARVVELTGAGVFEWSAAEAREACAALAAARGEGGTS